MSRQSHNEPVEVYAGTAWHAGLLKSMLEDTGIQAFLTDEIIGTLNPWWTAPGGAGSVKVVVDPADFEKAKQIALEFEDNLKKES
ncbi:MAG: DUF2007 domain-containing protein [Bacteroidales bacterium]|nr:DUF2007 domain-containing protein [Bacteroidales bacterium]